MAVRRRSFEQLQSVMDNEHESTYVCSCGQEYMSENYLKQHQQNDCKNHSIECSFCKETFSSSDILRDHLMLCGNKTDQCPNCRQFIRRSHFAYHYENKCAPVEKIETPPRPLRNLSNQRLLPNSNLPFARTDVPDGNSSRSIDKIQSSAVDARLVKCEYCQKSFTLNDYRIHQEQCVRNPNHRAQPQSVSSKQSNGIVHIPCEICNQQVDVPNWSRHVQNCRERENQRIEQRAQTMSREPITENLPCEYCGESISAKRFQSHQANCRGNPALTQYELIDHNRTREANQQRNPIRMQQIPLKNDRNHHRLIQSGGSFDGIQVYEHEPQGRSSEHRSRDSSKQQLIKKQSNGSPQRRRSLDDLKDTNTYRHAAGRTNGNRSPPRHLRPGQQRYEIIDNQDGQTLVKRNKSSWWKKLCCAKPNYS